MVERQDYNPHDDGDEEYQRAIQLEIAIAREANREEEERMADIERRMEEDMESYCND